LFDDACAVTEAKMDLSVANSAALVSTAVDRPHPSSQWVRAGIMLYGHNPVSQVQPPHPLQSAMRLVAPIIALRTIKSGESVGYGSTWTAERQSVIATVAIGYADGYPRHAANGTPVVLHNQRAPLAGTVSMDMITVDVTGLMPTTEIKVGDIVELWGPNLPVAEVAHHANTISYELLTGVTARVPRHLI